MNDELLYKLSEILYKENVINWINYWDTIYKKADNPLLNKEIEFVNKLSLEDREVLFNIIKRNAIDSTSLVLGVLDGVSGIDISPFEPEVYINGKYTSMELQDTFLEYIESYREF